MKKIIISILTFLILFSSTFADEKQKTLSNPKIKKIQPWKDKNLSLPEQVELYKKSLKENKTILKNKKFEVDLTEEVNEEELWNSWPVGATVYDATYGYCFGLTLQGSQLNQAFLNGDFLYAYLFT
ncbi:MAG TPA: hypothetical protein VII99_13030, partial [Bacteroidia bacterium]